MKTQTQVIDESGAVHSLTKRIGKGGQGEVWLEANGRRIVKLLHPSTNAEALRRQFAFLRRLDLGDLHVARPIAVLRPPHVGYVADFLADMVPIKDLIDAPPSGLLHWHIESGGLRRRLRLLAHAGEALLGLHGKGVVYADVSHNNVFVSEPATALEAWLIDLDNLSHDSDPKRAIYTPGYGAPEVVNRTSGCTSLSDAWAFAVLVWQTLTLTHPFIGDLVNDGEPELEEQALAGQLPWVGHSTDNRNACTMGLPHELVMGNNLFGLARRTFESGLDDVRLRPGISAWVERLHSTADKTIHCSGCDGTYLVVERSCPWCEEPRPAFCRVQIARWEPAKGVVPGAVRLDRLPLDAGGMSLPARVTEGHQGIAGREPHVELRLVARGVSVRSTPGRQAWVAPVVKANEEHHEVGERGRLIPRDGWMVLFEDPAKPQRVALIGRNP